MVRVGTGDPPEGWQVPSSVLLCLFPHRQDDVIGKVSLSHQQISAEPRGEGGHSGVGDSGTPPGTMGCPRCPLQQALTAGSAWHL